MKKIKLFTILLLSLMITLGMSQAVFAENQTANGGTYTYNGNDITDPNSFDIDKAIGDLEPGDDLTITFTYTNASDETTYWYMEDQIVTALEETAGKPENGGYTFTLTDSGPNGTTTICDSDKVGGEGSPLEGLKAATDATDEWFFIHELAPTQSGKTTLYIALDGESQVNSYMNTSGKLRVNYAVDTQAPGKDTVINKNTKTGDTFNPLFAIVALTAALLAALLAVLSYFRDRKDGEEA